MRALIAAAVLALAAPVAAPAVSWDGGEIVRIDSRGKHKAGRRHREERRAYREGYREGRRDARRYENQYYRPGHAYGHGRWSRGQVLPYEYRRYAVRNYYDYGWTPPPPGYAYYRTDTGDVLVAAIATGVILSVIAD